MSIKSLTTRRILSRADVDARKGGFAMESIAPVTEPSYDALTKLAAEYSKAEFAMLAVLVDDCVYVKSVHDCNDGILPRLQSLITQIDQTNAAGIMRVVEPHSSQIHLRTEGGIKSKYFAGAPLINSGNELRGYLIVGVEELSAEREQHLLNSLEKLAEMATSLLELEELQSKANENVPAMSEMRVRLPHPLSAAEWPKQKDLKKALENGEFELFYQPEMQLSTQKIVGVEALIRWRHPERGLIFPDQFIPLAEETGLIIPMGRWGLREACRQMCEWNQLLTNDKQLHVYVNLSAHEFAQEAICEYIDNLFEEYGLSGRQLGVELTETSLISNMSTAVRVLSGLRKLGITLLMDDFGTGYSSLNYLQSFSFDILKIDRSFVSRLEKGNSAMQIVHTIIELARVLGMEVIAEGIETSEQLKLLLRLGCRYGQGYLFSKPVPAREITEKLQLQGRILPESEFAGNIKTLKEIA